MNPDPNFIHEKTDRNSNVSRKLYNVLFTFLNIFFPLLFSPPQLLSVLSSSIRCNIYTFDCNERPDKRKNRKKTGSNFKKCHYRLGRYTWAI